MRTALFRVCVATALLGAGYVAGRLTPEPVVQAAQDEKVFEMRTYTANEGRLPALQARFRDHTLGFFKKYDSTRVGYWVPTDGRTAQTTLVYILSHPSREAAKANWAKFGADPEWRKVAAASQVDGTILAKPPESVYLKATDYSPIK